MLNIREEVSWRFEEGREGNSLLKKRVLDLPRKYSVHLKAVTNLM